MASGDAYIGTPLPTQLARSGEWYELPEECGEEYAEHFALGENANYCSKLTMDPEKGIDILVGGDSHTEQNLFAVAEQLGRDTDSNVLTVHRGGCKWMAPGDAGTELCNNMNSALIRYALKEKPKLVLLNVTAASPDSNDEKLVSSIEQTVRRLTSAGITVVGFRDNLRSKDDLYDCATGDDQQESLEGATGGCLLSRSGYFGDPDLVDDLLKIPGFYYIDMTDAWCAGDVCPTTIGNVHVYLDSNHVTTAYTKTMVPYVVDRIEEALGDNNPLKGS